MAFLIYSGCVIKLTMAVITSSNAEIRGQLPLETLGLFQVPPTPLVIIINASLTALTPRVACNEGVVSRQLYAPS